MAALRHFIPRLGEKGLPFFKSLKVSDKFVWNEEADVAFTQLKISITSPPVLTALQPNEVLFLYIVATDRIVSTVLMVECEELDHTYMVQRPIYFKHEVLNKSNTRYS